MSIRVKTALYFLFVVVFLTATLSYVVISRTLEKSNQEFVYHAQQKMNLVDGTYQAFFDNVINDVRYLAGNDLYEEIDGPLSTYLDPTPRPTDAQDVGGTEAEIERYYEEYAATRPHLRDIYLGTVDGGFVGLTDEPVGDYDPRIRPWYIAAMDSPGVPIITSAYLSAGTGSMVSVAMPVMRADDSLLGVQSADVTLKQLTELVRSVRLGQTGYMMLIDEAGTILCDPNDEENLFRNIADIDDPLFKALASSPLVSFEAERHGEMRQVSTYVSGFSNWRFVTVIDTAEIVGRQGALIESILKLAALMALIFVVLGMHIAKQVSAPIVHVTESLRRIAEGNAGLTEDLKVRTSDEIGDLAMWFNKFLQSARENQAEQLRAQKLEAIGQLAAGVAHEINTPTQYVSDNISFLSECIDDLAPTMSAYNELIKVAKDGGIDEMQLRHFREIADKADLQYLLDEMPSAMEQSKDGLDHIKKIVRAMKNFSHPGDEMKPVDLNLAIESTATVARNEWKFVAELNLELCENLPHVTCVPSEINQVVLNLIVNAAHTIGDVVEGTNEKGQITVTTRQHGEFVVIEVKDSGRGMAPDVQKRIFDPFFTTKAVGKGTGQGLAMAYDIVVKKHDGEIDVDSTPGSGTTFTIRLPIGSRDSDNDDFAGNDNIAGAAA